LFELITGKNTRFAEQNFLWYPFLSDYPEMENSHLIINFESERSAGWDGYAGSGIKETFKQACPNNPLAITTALTHMERLLTKYNFDGVMIDKIRFPSFANGIKDVFSCFCPYCRQKAAKYDLDLDEIQRSLRSRDIQRFIGEFDINAVNGLIGYQWVLELFSQTPFSRFIQFRCESILDVVRQISEKTKSLGKGLSMDVFSPSLTLLVGQDLSRLKDYADWVKPMIYRFGHGPSSLRSEIPALIKDVCDFFHLDQQRFLQWMYLHVDGLDSAKLEEIEKVAPLKFLLSESISIKKILKKTPVYLGLESVYIPGKLDIFPEHVEEIIENGKISGVDGFVLSWDLLHTPLRNLIPLKSLL